MRQSLRCTFLSGASFLSALVSLLVSLAFLGCGGDDAATPRNVQPYSFVQPYTFTLTGSMNTARHSHTATLLNSGMVLIAGGRNDSSGVLSRAELYDPVTGTFSFTGNLNIAREGHTATLLNNGMVLIAGGNDPVGRLDPSTELFNPATGTFTATGNLNEARRYHTATLLNNGMVLIAGGQGSPGVPPAYDDSLSSAELYDPGTGTFTPTGSLDTACLSPIATLLNNGMVLFNGGVAYRAFRARPETFCDAELYNPATGTFTVIGNNIIPRAGQTATLLNNGMVLIAGGAAEFSAGDPRSEVYDPATETFTFTGNLNTARVSHTATLLNGGMVLIAGGQDYRGVLSSAELYNPATGTFSFTGNLNTARDGHTATLLKNGKVLIAGGVGGGTALSSSEVYW